MVAHKRMLSFFTIILSIILLHPVIIADEVERILDFKSYICVRKDRTIQVTETVRVVSTGAVIQRGIYRTFPTQYRDRFGNRVRINFTILDVQKNGSPEPYHTEDAGNGVKVYFGSSDVYLDPGEYTYTFTYECDRQIGFFKEFDELYWNVTGLDWDFSIERVEAIVELPAEATPIHIIAYTGSQGAQGTDYAVDTDANGNTRFTTTTILNPHEGITIAISWQKGLIPEPSSQHKIGFLFVDNKNTVVAFLGLIILFLYYYLVWLNVGKDPEKGVIIPRFEPPPGFSPAATRYVMRMGYSDRVFSSAIVNLAVKGYLTITDNAGAYVLRRVRLKDSTLSAGEKSIAGILFAYKDTVEIKQSNHQVLQKAITALKKSLKQDFEKLHFRKNSGKMVFGILFTVVIFAAIALTSAQPTVAGMLAVWLTGWSAGVTMMVYMSFKAWKTAIDSAKTSVFKFGGPLILTLFALPFLAAEILVFFGFAGITSPLSVLIVFIVIFLDILFYRLLKAPTILGRKMMDHIEGFKMYLETAEEDRLNMLDAPHKTPELFEKFLPYALALDVEVAWTEKFADILSRASQGSATYSPAWYSGKSLSAFSSTGFSANLGSSLSSAISSSSHAPGSRSGSSGGGSSGGGGGGGGGGGW
ncbi:MAG: DUF2207 domain-containing protein [Candidatus Zhuqueibacterota bacterium]